MYRTLGCLLLAVSMVTATMVTACGPVPACTDYGCIVMNYMWSPGAAGQYGVGQYCADFSPWLVGRKVKNVSGQNSGTVCDGDDNITYIKYANMDCASCWYTYGPGTNPAVEGTVPAANWFGVYATTEWTSCDYGGGCW